MPVITATQMAEVRGLRVQSRLGRVRDTISKIKCEQKSTCLACTRLWVQFPVPKEKKKGKSRSQYFIIILTSVASVAMSLFSFPKLIMSDFSFFLINLPTFILLSTLLIKLAFSFIYSPYCFCVYIFTDFHAYIYYFFCLL
jgi:hypothetical protein